MRISAWTGWGVLLGVALGGFFDGILLHQILQWHHLLSLVPGAGDLRMQVIWDGWFHALMYGLAGLGLWGLWRVQRSGETGSGRGLAAALLAGVGLWHVVDSILSHWVLGIHRIRIDSPNPLAWDIGWFLAFGIVPLLWGWWLARGRGTGPAGVMLLAALTIGAAGAGGWALQPPADQRFVTVAFRPGMEAPQVLAALAESEARLVWTDRAMGVVVVDMAPERRWDLYLRGAMLVSGSGLPAGCFDWSRS
ncbi:DUF2243 domain-containing protein [Polymorphobacter sp.]|uniref:DUF2243 domain-containing protein n=1 Tax=Polymorphobacter sp. TaxID=1909290 RepID=UPI003F728DD6